MEIFKTQINNKTIKLTIGAELNMDKTGVQGNVELDIENQSFFVDIMNAVFDESRCNIIVDLANVTYIDSSGLWAIFEGHKKAMEFDLSLILLRPTKDVKRVLDITKMSSKLKIFEDEAAALQSLG